MPGQFTGNRGQAQGFIGGLIREGLTNSQIVDFLRGSGLSYRLQYMYSDANRLRLEQAAGQGIQGLNMNTPVPTNLMREWEGQTDYRFRVVVQYEYTPPNGGDIVQAATTLYYDSNPSVSDVMDDWSVRVKTLEGGFAGYSHIGVVEGISEINYFYNVPKRSQ